MPGEPNNAAVSAVARASINRDAKPLRLAILGTRGIPANYGGFETFAEELSTRLVQRGHEVTVYVRSHYSSTDAAVWRGVRRVILPTIRHKYLDTVVHTLLSVLHSISRRYDAILICNAANSFTAWIPRLFGVPTAVNVDGIERLRSKWGPAGRLFYRVSEWLSLVFPTVLVADAECIARYWREGYGKRTAVIAYGNRLSSVPTAEILDKYRLQKDGYYLYVSRLEPENNAHVVVREFEKTSVERKLVVVGDAPYAKEYIEKLHATNDQRIIFTGFVFGKGYEELQSHACAYINATQVGGTHPALVEAMGVGNCIISADTVENREVAGDAAVYFELSEPGSLAGVISSIDGDAGKRRGLKLAAAERAETHYNWDKIVSLYEDLFREMARETEWRRQARQPATGS